jgi:hypothetical protein
MKIDFKQIINIKTIKDIKKFNIDKPIFLKNYLFHYLIIFNKLKELKLMKFPINKENEEGMNGFHLAANYGYMDILFYLIKEYPDYIYNKTLDERSFVNFLSLENLYECFKLDLDWNDLLKNIIYQLLIELNFKQLMKLIKVYRDQTSLSLHQSGEPDLSHSSNLPEKYYLHTLFLNQKLSDDQIIKVLDQYDLEQLNMREDQDLGLIFTAISTRNEKFIKYLIKRKIDLNYYSMYHSFHPLRSSWKYPIGFELIWDAIKDTYDYTSTNKNLENIAHFILKNNLLNKTTLDILNYCSMDIWYQKDINKITPLDFITKLEFNKYNFLFKNKKKTNLYNKKLLERIKGSQWYNLLNNLYQEEKDEIVLESYPYVHRNGFQARFKDISLYCIYLISKYKTIYLPKIQDYHINSNLGNFEITYPDSFLEEHLIFPWMVVYENQNLYWIHNALNNLINAERRSNKYDFAWCFLSVKYEGTFHANIIIFDFIHLTVERFDPFGNTVDSDINLDNILEEELTWNTGLTYLKPSDYMPYSGFQDVSDELNPYNQKSGDFGGYCLAWCIWYFEHRIMNKKVKSKDLVNKLLKKISELDISFSEYIRNYAGKLADFRFELLKNEDIDEKKISNSNFNNIIEEKLTKLILDNN